MASSSSVPSASVAGVAKISSSASLASHRRHARVTFRPPSKPKKLLLFPSKGSRLYWNRSSVAKAQLNESVSGSSNDSIPAEPKSELPVPKEKGAESGKRHFPATPLSEEAISEFMTQVTSLLKLVDSKDIVELQLKRQDCELIIRKKEALPQPPAQAPVVMMHPSSPPAAMPSQFPPPTPAASMPSPPAASSAPPPTPSAPKPAKSSHPPLKSPMSGTFYRSAGPGLPPFVKVGDKVNKGQILCIIEAMKLMNDIEADQSGTVVEVLVDDGKPVGVDQPMFVIEP